MTLTVPDEIASPQDLVALMSEIHDYGTWASRQLIKQKVGSSQTIPQPRLSKVAADVIRDYSGGKPMNQKAIDSLTRELEAYKKNAVIVTVTLAAIPSGELKARIVAWFRKEVRPDLLVSFRMNRQILGGMVVASGSHIHDWSFRRALVGSNASFSEVLARV